VTDVANSVCAAWGDCDNDGYLDLFVSVFGGNNLLYRNNRDSTFTKITTGHIVTDGGNSVGCTWGDYDNDGNLDLFVSNASGQRNLLYRNNGDGTFAKMTIGNIVTDVGDSIGCTWGDYDNDGFLDLFVANRSGQNNFLYHNDGNSNHWLRVKCVGTVSNRAAIGAKVRIKASIAGIERWQLRQISGGDGENNSDSLMAQLGLGDATVVDAVRVEWPSGVVQEFEKTAANQTLIITEPPRLDSDTSATGSVYSMNLIGGAGLRYAIEASTNLVNWTPIIVFTNSSRTTPWADLEATNYLQRFYRAVQRQ
jgi:enediyne biosynthesis protein E4